MQEQTFRVGEWLVLAADNKITRDGRLLVLEPRLIDMLSYFAHHPDTVLSRDELIDNVWKRNIVTNHVVTQCISELRKYLKDGRPDAPEYIVTVPKRGYKLVEPVIWCEEGGADFTMPAQAPVKVVIDHEPEDGSGQLPLSTTVAESQRQQADALNSPATATETVTKSKGEKKRLSKLWHSRFWVWVAFLSSLLLCISLVGLAVFNQRVPVAPAPMLLNPRDIDIRIQGATAVPTGQISFLTLSA